MSVQIGRQGKSQPQDDFDGQQMLQISGKSHMELRFSTDVRAAGSNQTSEFSMPDSSFELGSNPQLANGFCWRWPAVSYN